VLEELVPKTIMQRNTDKKEEIDAKIIKTNSIYLVDQIYLIFKEKHLEKPVNILNGIISKAKSLDYKMNVPISAVEDPYKNTL